jgi:DNA invertase Pin-like site-specific DNA recombinase
VLLIAKLDRLTSNVAFISTLCDSGVQFVCADMPEANTLTIGVMATMFQHEREVISKRTRKALAEKKSLALSWAGRRTRRWQRSIAEGGCES